MRRMMKQLMVVLVAAVTITASLQTATAVASDVVPHQPSLTAGA